MAYTNGDEIPRVQYTATASQQIFAIPFPFDADGDIKVYRNATLFVLGVSYVITGTNVELTSGATAGDIITILRDTLVERATDFPTSGPFNIAALNAEFDRVFQATAEIDVELNRTLTLSPTDVQTTPFVLPDKAARLGRALQFNATTGAPEAGPTSADITQAQTYAANALASANTAITNAGVATTKAAEASNSAAEAAASAADLSFSEGSFTPVLIGLSTAGVGTYTQQIGRYTRIGNLCFVCIQMTVTAHTGTGNMEITGLPFTSRNLAGYNQALATVISNMALGVTNAQLAAFVPPNTTLVQLRAQITGTAVAAITMDTSFSMTLTGVYQVEA